MILKSGTSSPYVGMKGIKFILENEACPNMLPEDAAGFEGSGSDCRCSWSIWSCTPYVSTCFVVYSSFWDPVSLKPSLSSCFFLISASSFLFLSSSSYLTASSIAYFFPFSSFFNQLAASCASLLASSSLFFASYSSNVLVFSEVFPFPPIVVIFCLNLFLREVMFFALLNLLRPCPKNQCIQN